MSKKPSTGYEKKKKWSFKKRSSEKKHGYVSSLIVSPTKTVSFGEKLVKFLIYIALRLAIRPKKWKHPEKNYEIIDRTYKKIMSADFIFIPSSVAFYIVMAFMPIFTLIMFLYSIEPIRELLGSAPIYEVVNGVETTTIIGWDSDPLMDTLNKFIPGIDAVLKQISLVSIDGSEGAEVGAIILTFSSLITTTWIAAGGMAKLVFAQSHLFEHKYVGGYWMNKLKGMSIVLALTLFLFLMFTVQIYINTLIMQLENTGAPMWSVQLASYSFLAFATFAMVFLGFLLFFKFSPRFKIKFKHVVPGAMVATVPTAGFLVLFGFITSLWSYGAYGVIGVIMYIGMTALLISIFVFMGIITNAAYYKTFVSDHTNTKWTLSKK